MAYIIWSIPNTLVVGTSVGFASLLPIVMWIFVFNLIYFVAQPYLLEKSGGKYLLLLKAIGPLCALVLNEWRDGKNEETIYGFMAMINYDIIFMAQGVVDKLYHDQMLE